jgi:acyl carrier protein
VLAPKAVGAWHLHAATLDLPLDYFVCFSSVVAELGNPGQAAYAAANAFLDALAAFRRQHGLPGLSVNWGAFADAGVLARNEQLATHLSRQGWKGIPVQHAFEALGSVMNRPVAQVAIADVDWQTWGRSAPTLARSPRFAGLVANSPTSAGRSGEGDWSAELLSLPPEERLAGVQQRVREAVAGVLGLDPAKLDPQRRLDQLGLASLMAVELQHVLAQRTGVVISAMDMTQGPSVADLAKLVLSRLESAGEMNGDATVPPQHGIGSATTERPEGVLSSSGG